MDKQNNDNIMNEKRRYIPLYFKQICQYFLVFENVLQKICQYFLVFENVLQAELHFSKTT